MAFDAIVPVNLGRGSVDVSPTVTTFRITPTLSRDILKTLDISNTGVVVRRVTVYLVPDGGSPGSSNALIPEVEVQGNGVFQWSGAQVLEEGDSIQATANGSGLTLHASGGEAR